MKLNRENFKIEGCYPPTIMTTISGVRYAISGSSWVEIEDDVTMEDALKGWISTMPTIGIEIKSKRKTTYAKRPTKKELLEKYSK